MKLFDKLVLALSQRFYLVDNQHVDLVCQIYKFLDPFITPLLLLLIQTFVSSQLMFLVIHQRLHALVF